MMDIATTLAGIPSLTLKQAADLAAKFGGDYRRTMSQGKTIAGMAEAIWEARGEYVRSVSMHDRYGLGSMGLPGVVLS